MALPFLLLERLEFNPVSVIHQFTFILSNILLIRGLEIMQTVHTAVMKMSKMGSNHMQPFF